jgi:hypothetical protein
MASNVRGYGKLCFREADTGLLRPLRADSFELTSEQETELVESFPANDCGPLVAVDSKQGPEQWSLSLGLNSIDNTDLEILFDQKFGVAPTILVPSVNVYPVGAGGTVSIAALAVGDTVSATVMDDNGPAVQLKPGATSSATDFVVAAGSLTLDAAYIGKSVSVYLLKSQVNLKLIGGSNPNSQLGELELIGVGCTTRSTVPFKIWLPRLKRSGGVNFGSGADSFELTYDVLTKSGFNKPYAIW